MWWTLALRSVPGLGDRSALKMIRYAGSARSAWEATVQRPDAFPFLRGAVLNRLHAGPDWKRVEKIVGMVRKMGAWIIPWGAPDYPAPLRNLAQPPLLLYGLGERDVLHSRDMVAIVGSRRATHYGRRVAGELARGLTGAGAVTVSGFALGIDSAAHKAAVQAGGKTLAVLGCGLDVDYPRRNKGLRREIISNGALISEFEPGIQPEAANFPRRNRIISGLSKAVVVVEAGERSGSLITAAYALEQGKDVLAVPGSIYSPVSQGTHWLIRQGAGLVGSVRDLLDELGLAPCSCDSGESCQESSLDPKEAAVLTALGPYPLHLDDLAARLNMSVSEVGRILVNLELSDMVTALPGQMYLKKG